MEVGFDADRNYIYTACRKNVCGRREELYVVYLHMLCVYRSERNRHNELYWCFSCRYTGQMLLEKDIQRTVMLCVLCQKSPHYDVIVQ